MHHPSLADVPEIQDVSLDHLLLPTTTDPNFGRPVCVDNAWHHHVWFSAIDDDEFLFLRDGTCIADFVPRYTAHGSLYAQVI